MSTHPQAQEPCRPEQGTGSAPSVISFRRITVSFGSYEVGIMVDQQDRFLGIAEIRLPRDFRSADQIRRSTGAVEPEDPQEDNSKR